MLFKRTPQVVAVSALTGTAAKAIYARLIAGENENDLFMTGIPFAHSAEVVAEAKRIETLVVAYMRDEPGTEAQLRATISSDLLTVATVVTDVRAWSDGNPDESPSWNVYKASFNNV